MIERWQSEQVELRAASQALLALVEQPVQPARSTLIAARWRVARALLRYLPLVDRMVYARLRLHRDSAATAAAARFMAEAEAIYTRYEKHAFRWTPEQAESGWALYRASVRQKATMVRDRLDRELAELGPYLATAPDLPAMRHSGDRNWARDGWRFRDLLGLDDAPPQAATAR